MSIVILALAVNFLKIFFIFLGSLYRAIRKFCLETLCINYGEPVTVAVKPADNMSDMTMIDLANVSLDDYSFNRNKISTSANTSKPASREAKTTFIAPEFLAS